MNEVVLLAALGTDDLDLVLRVAASVPSHHRTVVVTSSLDWPTLRRAGLRWEYVMGPGAWGRLDPARAWEDYALSRVRSLLNEWRPRTVIHLGAEHISSELTAELTAVPPAPPARAGKPGTLTPGELDRRVHRLEDLVAKLTSEFERRTLAEGVRDLIEGHVRNGAGVAVISRGDPLLVQAKGASHFPQDDQGAWAGFYPADDDDAMRQLERVRDRGVRYLLVPPPAAWWLDHYSGLAAYLRCSTGAVLADDSRGILFRLPDRTVEPRR